MRGFLPRPRIDRRFNGRYEYFQSIFLSKQLNGKKKTILKFHKPKITFDQNKNKKPPLQLPRNRCDQLSVFSKSGSRGSDQISFYTTTEVNGENSLLLLLFGRLYCRKYLFGK